MKHLLVHTKTFTRIERELLAFRDHVSPIVMDDEGDLKHPWGKSEAESLILYGTQDAYFSPAAPAFFQAAFASPVIAWFQSSAAGIEHPILQALGKQSDLYTSSHEQSDAIAEWALWAGLDHFQAGSARRAAQSAQDWARLGFRELCETHWLIVGFGSIGQAAGRKLRALGAEVTGVRRSAGSHPAADTMITPDEVSHALPQVDAVLLALPHTPETEGFANAAFFAAMQPGALFLNVGRGALVDEAALLEGLDQGRPGHATLDVFKTEPLPEDSAFWTHPSVTMTAHIAALTEASKVRTDRLFLRNLDAYLNGQAMQNVMPKSEFA